MATLIQIRRDSSTTWTSTNPILAQGEFGLETDTGYLKIGDGTSTWSNLGYITTDSSASSWGDIGGTLSDQTDLQTALDGKQSALTFGIADTNAVKIDSAGVADNEYARFTANGLESRSISEVLSDIGAEPADANIRKTTSTITEFISGLIASPADGDYVILRQAPFAGTITSITTKSSSGTCTLTGKVNTTALGGTANSVSSTEQEQAHASSNTFAAGDDIEITVSSNSSCANMEFTVKYTRALV